MPILVTFCPLCNSSIAFDRRLNGEILSFGVSGLLRKSDMVMYDHQSESFWQQTLGEAVVGIKTGQKLRMISARRMPWQAFLKEFPKGLVMQTPNYNRPYGKNPYTGYDNSTWPFLYQGDAPPYQIEPLARVVRVGNKAWLLKDIAKNGVIVEGGFILSWQNGMNSALDTGSINNGRDVGFVRVQNKTGEDLPHDVMFAFAFHAFFPDGQWMIQ